LELDLGQLFESTWVAPLRVALPFQTVETVNESAQERQATLDLFGRGGEPEWRNRLIWGDKKYVLSALLAEFAGKVDLIYVDPPFATGQDFSRLVEVGDASFSKQASMIEVKAYRDTWGKGLDSYLQWLYEMAAQLHELLSDTGSLYLHLDPGVSHVAKSVLDEIFGPQNFRNEIIWKRTTAHSSANRFGPVHDVLLYYAKSDRAAWYPQTAVLSEKYLADKYRNVEPDGRRYRLSDITGSGIRHGETGQPWRGIDVTARRRHWMVPPVQLEELDAAGRVYWPPKGEMPAYKRYLTEEGGMPLQDVWDDISPINSQALERLGYPTQKPVALLERVIQSSSTEGDLILDCVCGSGTSAIAAEGLGRRWIVADLSRFAVHTTRKRLLSTPSVRPFVVQNLGKYERQLWQSAEFGEGVQARAVASYRSFILEIFKATPIEGYAWLHGAKQGRLVHVGTVDAPITVGDVRQIATEFRRAIGTGADAPTSKAVDVLGWDFAFELNEVARQEASRAGIDVHFWRIPREVLDKRAVEQGDVRFFELAALAVEVTVKKRRAEVRLTDFVIPLDDVPEGIQAAISEWAEWIDYWAIDWDNKADTFHNEWQTYRTRKEPQLLKESAHEYTETGQYQVVVKVIDILGNDTTKTIRIAVA
jgi:adenine-specific DNA-methyltransferase